MVEPISTKYLRGCVTLKEVRYGVRKICSLGMAVLILVMLLSILPPSMSAAEPPARLMIIEHWHGGGRVTLNVIPSEDNSMENPDYKLLPFHWYGTARYWINPSNKYGFSELDVVKAITASANTWDEKTSATVFSYEGITSRSAGRRDNFNVVAWGRYRAGVIAVTYIWYIGSQILETDTLMNNLYKWSLSGEAGKMDVRNIMTHEFGHWCGLDDLYNDEDYWLTMYGYSSYGETYKRTLGLGDIKGLLEVYGE